MWDAKSSTPAGKDDISALLDRHAAQQPHAPALTVDDRTWTYGELHARALRAASLLHERGLRAGEIAAFPMGNSIEQTALFFGTWRLGATPLPLPETIPEPELAAVLRAAGATLVVRDAQGLEERPPWGEPPRTARLLKAQATGGSTGVPKVLLDKASSVIDLARDPMGYGLGNCLFLPGPTYHSGPMSHLTEGIARGLHVVFMRRFDAAGAVELIARHQPHFALFVPTMMHRIIQLPGAVREKAAMSSLKRVWHTAAPCPPWLKREWIEWLGGEVIWEIFGGSEGVAVTVIAGDEWLAHPGSVGRVVGGEIAILDERGQPVPAGTVGEIFMRNATPNRMAYAGEVARRWRGEWESFGDLGRFDEDGYLYLSDRRQDTIISGGQNVYPAEVEAAILRYPGVLDAAVFGQDDDDLGEMVCALVAHAGELPDEADLVRHLQEQLVRYKIPRRIGFTTHMLRNDAGKVRRSQLHLESGG